MKIGKIAIVIGIVVFALGIFVFKTYWQAGEFKDLKPYSQLECAPIKSVVGAEDITVDPSSGIAFVSCTDRRAARKEDAVQGAIYAYDLNTAPPALVNLTQNISHTFQPHGISFYQSSQGQKFLFVVNRRFGGKSPDSNRPMKIEIFEFKEGDLNHLETITDPLMTSPNDILAVGPRQFYVTNDHGFSFPLFQVAEDFLQLSFAYVLYYNGETMKKAASDLAYANGINISPDGDTLYVTSTLKKYVRVYSRDKASGELKERGDIRLKTGVDNVEVDQDGNLYLGCHPKLLTFVKHSKDASKLSPSEVLKLHPKGQGAFDTQVVFLDKGEMLSGSSVATVYKNRMLIGSVFEHFLDCRNTRSD
jgi:arylesterase/paraoxonase